MSGLIVDLFAGGGGTSLGIERALGRSPDIAINHAPDAVAMHATNHPGTQHLCGSVWDYAPLEVTRGAPVKLLWASPTCTHFSKAKGGQLRDAKIRSLAWVFVRWLRETRPEVAGLENVEEFAGWGPLLNDGTVCQRRKGRTFQKWVSAIRKLGYSVDWRELRGCDYGAPTTRKRLFVLARRDGAPIEWPAPTHGRGLLPYRTAAECIDWSIPCPSIFDRPKPLAIPTMQRIARGVVKFVLEANNPYVVPAGSGLAIPSMVHRGNGERVGQAPRIYDIRAPLGTIVAQGQKHALVMAFLEKAFGGHSSPGQDVRNPLGTITTTDHHRLIEVRTGKRNEQVRAFLTKFYGTSTGQDLQLPLGTITAGGWKHGLVVVEGQSYEIADIGMRMLTPRELARAQGFGDSYELAKVGLPSELSKSAQIRMIGNSVCPDVAAAIVRSLLVNQRTLAA